MVITLDTVRISADGDFVEINYPLGGDEATIKVSHDVVPEFVQAVTLASRAGVGGY